MVRDALAALDLPLLGYRDTPHATRLSVTGLRPDEVAVDITDVLDDKLAALRVLRLAARVPVRRATAALRAFAAAEAARCGHVGGAEVLAGNDDMRARRGR